MHILTTQHKGLTNAKRLCNCSMLCLRPKSSLYSWRTVF